ncbi:hypothetical protein LOD99_11146 [Oopsacas minuta]|uniref:TTF-type domain-containing protein n=1 Tax=Oopsacas minuta TaxID=111878 RepID=A0AAV7K7K3_9METZ|nr:hypothetical protein LOD99_11146 [Oopsacas minuta]
MAAQIEKDSETEIARDSESEKKTQSTNFKQASLFTLWGGSGRDSASKDSETASADSQEPVEGIDSPGQNQNSDSSKQLERIVSDGHSGGESDPLDPANGPIAANQWEGPYQPNDVCFPSRQLGESLRSFRSEWFVGRPWIEYSVKLDSAFCFPCRLFAASHPGCGEPAFTHTGFRFWKNATERFRNHNGTIVHHSAMTAWTLAKTQKNSIASQLSLSHKAQVEKNRAHLRTISETILFLGKQNIPLRGHDEAESSINRGNFLEILALRAKDNKDLLGSLFSHRIKYTSPQIQNELISIIGRLIQEQIVKEVHDSQYFAVMVDETMDIAKIEQAAVCVRYLSIKGSNAIIQERFLGFWKCASTTGEALYNLLKSVLCELTLCLHNVRAQCYDGAANMRGKYSGLASRVQEEEHRALYIHCHAHQLNLVLCEACMNIREVRNALGTVSTLYSFIEGSAKRHHLFHEIQEKLGISRSVTLKALCETRWSCRYRAIHAVKLTYSAILQSLEDIAEHHAAKSGADAASLLRHISTFDFLIMIEILDYLFAITDSFSRELQSQNLDISSLQGKIQSVIDSLTCIRNGDFFHHLWSSAEKLAEDHQLDPPSEPRRRKVPRCFDDGSQNHDYSSAEDRYRTAVFYATIDILLSELKERFAENDYEILRNINEVLLKWQPNSHLIQKLSEFYDFDSHQLECEMRVFYSYVKNNIIKDTPSVLDLAQLFVDKNLNVMFPLVWKLILIAACIPVSTASPERSFSALRRLKTYLRSTIGQQRLSGLALMNIEAEVARSLETELDLIVDKFASSSQRRSEFY